MVEVLLILLFLLSSPVVVSSRRAAMFGGHVHHKLVDGSHHVRHHLRHLAVCPPPETRHQLGKFHSSSRLQVSESPFMLVFFCDLVFSIFVSPIPFSFYLLVDGSYVFHQDYFWSATSFT